MANRGSDRLKSMNEDKCISKTGNDTHFKLDYASFKQEKEMQVIHDSYISWNMIC